MFGNIDGLQTNTIQMVLLKSSWLEMATSHPNTREGHDENTCTIPMKTYIEINSDDVDKKTFA